MDEQRNYQNQTQLYFNFIQTSLKSGGIFYNMNSFETRISRKKK